MTTLVAARPGSARLLAGQLGYAGRELWRARIVTVFTFLLPLTWLVIIGAVAGNERLDDGVRVMQFAAPSAVAMGVLYAAFPTVAITMAIARERGILKRIRGTPLPPWTYVAGRIGGAVGFAVVAVATMLAIGVAGYDVRILARSALATFVTLVVATACFAALGLVAAVSPSAGVAQAVSIAAAVALSFVSELFTIGAEVPAWLGRVGDVFPLKPFVTALRDQFNPFLTGSGWDLSALAVMAAWGIAGGLVAARAFSWDPAAGGRRAGAGARTPRRRAGALPGARLVAEAAGRPSAIASLLAQIRWANRAAWRDPGWVFFAVAMPVGLYALVMAMLAPEGFRVSGIPIGVFYAASMTAYGAGVTAFVNMPQAVVAARDRGVLKRLRGTPLSPATYLAGRTVSVLWLALLTGLLVLAVGIAFHDVAVPVSRVPVVVGVLVLGTLTLAACGFAVASMVPSSKAMGAVGLAVLLPLSFFSDVFVIGDLPAWMTAVGNVFPLRHFVHALAGALDPAGVSVAWADVVVMLVWLASATALAVRRFRWEPRL